MAASSTSATIRAAALSAGLRLPGTVYANVAAALAAGKHLILTGPPGAGKTTLAMAIARAASQAGQAHGATVLTGDHRWEPTDALIAAAQQGRWVIADEIDRADPTRRSGRSPRSWRASPSRSPSTGEAAPAEGWRIIATAQSTPAGVGRAHPPVRARSRSARRRPTRCTARCTRPPTATRPRPRAAERLLPLAEIKPLGAGVFLDAARHAAARNQAVPADDLTLAREAFAAYVAPLLGDLDDEQQRRVQHLLG